MSSFPRGLRHYESDGDSSSLSWLSICEQAKTDDNYSSSAAAGKVDGGRNVCGEDADDVKPPPGLGVAESPVQDGSDQPRCVEESAAEILGRFGLDKEDLEELNNYPEDQITPENLKHILMQISLRKKRKQDSPPESPKPSEEQLLGKSAMKGKSSGSQINDQNKTQADAKPRKPKCSKPNLTLKKETAGFVGGGHKKHPIVKKKQQQPGGLKHEQQHTEGEKKSTKSQVLLAKRTSGPVPPPAVINDYIGIIPGKFPHRCLICNRGCFNTKIWLSHLETDSHLQSCRLLQEKYPDWYYEQQQLFSRKAESSASYRAQHHREKGKHWSCSGSRSSQHKPGSNPSSPERYRSGSSSSRSRSPVPYHRPKDEQRISGSGSPSPSDCSGRQGSSKERIYARRSPSMSPHGYRRSYRSRSRSPWYVKP